MRPKRPGAGRRSCVKAGSRIRSVRSARPSRRPSLPTVRLLADLGDQVSAARKYPVPIRIVYTDQNLRTSYTHHFSASSSARSALSRGGAGYVGKLGDDLVGQTTSTRRRSSTRRSPASRRRCRTSNSACRSAPASSARSHGCRELLPQRALRHAAESRPPHGRTSFTSYSLSKNMTNQPENTTGLISSIPNPSTSSRCGARRSSIGARRRSVLGLEPAARRSATGLLPPC